MQKKKKNMSKVNFYILGPLHVKSQQEKITKGEKITQQENSEHISYQKLCFLVELIFLI